MSTNRGKLDRPIDRPAVDEPQIGLHRSLEGVHSSVHVPHPESGFWPQWRAVVGPPVLVYGGYIDAGDWGADLQAGGGYQEKQPVGGGGVLALGGGFSRLFRWPGRGGRREKQVM